MRLAVYGVVLVIALGSVLLGLDRLPAPMSPMVDTAAGLAAKPAPALPAPTVQASPSIPATIGAPIVPQTLAAPASPAPVSPPATAGASAQATAPLPASEPEVRCNVDACTAAYRSFRPNDCTYQPSNGPRRLCTK
jgi:hypothetical protein